MDIEKLTELFSSLSPLKINNNLCTRVITPKSGCNKCLEVCPNKSLSFQNGSWQVADCLYCGLCVAACPNNVFKLDEDHLLSQCSSNNSLLITCSPLWEKIKTRDKDIMKINCLSQLYPELILKLSADSQQVIIYINPDQCSECLNFSYFPLLKEIKKFPLSIENLNFITNLKNLKPFLTKNKTKEKNNQQNSRRLFLKSIFNSAKEVPQQLINSTFSSLAIETDDTNNHNENKKSTPDTKSTFTKRKLVYDLLQNKPNGIDPNRTLPYKNLRIDNCNFCGACTKLCPTKALTIVKDDADRKKLIFQPKLCTECDICQDICFFQGISWDNELTIADFLNNQPTPLLSTAKRTCSSCGQDFWQVPGDSDTCLLCKPKFTDNI